MSKVDKVLEKSKNKTMEENLSQDISQTIPSLGEPAAVTQPPVSLTNQPPLGSWWKVGMLVVGVLLAGSIAYTGYQYSQKQPKPTFPTIFSTPTPTPDETANWKTYTNTIYSYELKYPSTWAIIAPTPGVSETTSFTEIRKDINNYKISTFAISSAKDVIDGLNVDTTTIISSTIKNIQWKGKSPSIEKKIIAGGNAQVLQGETVDNIFYTDIFLWKGKSYTNIQWKAANKEEQQLFNQILSTFKFVDQNQADETTSWETYINQTGKYSLSYPANWYLSEEKDLQSGDIPSHLKTSPDLKLSPASNTSDESSGQIIIVSVANNRENLSIENFIKENDISAGDISLLNFQPVIIGGVEGKKTSALPGMFNNDDIFLKKGQRIYVISLIRSPGIEIKTSTFDQILSTFKFLD